MQRNKNKKVGNSANNDSYDLGNNFKKISKYSRTSKNRQTTNNIQEKRERGNYADSTEASYTDTTNIPTWDRYDRLEDKLYAISDKNDNEHSNLRIEFNQKVSNLEIKLENLIDKKLSKQWYIWTIIALVAFVTVIYTLSYSGILRQVDKNTDDIRDLIKNSNIMNLKIEQINMDMNTRQKENNKPDK